MSFLPGAGLQVRRRARARPGTVPVDGTVCVTSDTVSRQFLYNPTTVHKARGAPTTRADLTAQWALPSRSAHFPSVPVG